MTLAHRRRERFWVRWLLLVLGLAMIAGGYWSLSVEPDVSADEAQRRAFIGLALVITGAALALISRWIPR